MANEQERRWDNDERGTGVGDARRLVAGVLQLAEALGRPGWVAEQPEAHLLPSMSAWISAIGTQLEMVSTALGTDGTFEIEVRWLGRPGDLRTVRAQVFGLIGQVAESAVYVRQRSLGGSAAGANGADEVLYEVATGMMDDDTTFAGHGHVVLVKVVGISRGR